MSSLSRCCSQCFALSVFGKLDSELLCRGRGDSSTRQKGPLFKPPGCHSGQPSTVFFQCILFYPRPPSLSFTFVLPSRLYKTPNVRPYKNRILLQAACRNEQQWWTQKSSVLLDHGLTGNRTVSFWDLFKENGLLFSSPEPLHWLF